MAVQETYLEQRMRGRMVADPDPIPSFLRSQLRIICDKAIGPYRQSDADGPSHHANDWWKDIEDAMEIEVEAYSRYRAGKNPRERIGEFLRLHKDVDDWLMLMQLICQRLVRLERIEVSIEASATKHQKYYRGATLAPRDAIDEINRRLRPTGYQFEINQIIPMGNPYVHEEITKPALALLQEPLFETASKDFMTAHRHNLNREYKDVTTSGLRAFESTLKAICVDRKWKYESGDRAAELIALVRRKNLFPDMGKGFDSYVAMMKTGVPGVRNAHGGHGSGPKDLAPPEYVAQYALDLTAANIRMLIEAYKELPAMPGIT